MLEDEKNYSSRRPQTSFSADSNRRKSRRDNPFYIPPVSELLAGRGEQRIKTLQRKDLVKSLSLAERSEFNKPNIPDVVRSSRRSSTRSSARSERRKGNESKQRGRISEFIASKREIYLMQMLMDRKNREIRKIDRLIQNEEAKYNEQEQIIDEMSTNLKIQNTRAEASLAKARKKAENAVRLRVEATKKFKMFQIQVANIKQEITKNEELLESYREYYKFLASITPDNKEMMDYYRKPEDLLRELERIEMDNLFIIKQCQAFTEMEKRGTNSVEGDLIRTEEAIVQMKKDLADLKDVEEFNLEAPSSAALDSQLEYFRRRIGQLYIKCYHKDSDLTPIGMLEKLENDMETMYRKINLIDPIFVWEKQTSIDKIRREKIRLRKQELKEEEQRLKTEQALERATKPIKRRTGRPLYSRTTPIRIHKVSESKRQEQLLEQQRLEHFLYGSLYSD